MSTCITRLRGIIALLCFASILAIAQTPPITPTITEPLTNGQIVNPADVHMETLPMVDPDAGNTHFCTDWEIWTVSPSERVWITACIQGVERLHTHLGDGVFGGSHAGRTEFFYDTNYELRVRHRDNTMLWSPYATRSFVTGSQSQTYALEIDDVSNTPTPELTDENSSPIILTPGSPAASVRLESGSSELMLQISGLDGVSNAITNPGPLANHRPVRVVVSGGSAGAILSPSHILFTDDAGQDQTIYLPSLNLGASQQAFFWVSRNGSSYNGNSSQTEPDFSDLAQGAPVPWVSLQAGFKVEIVATGFQLPVNIAFVPNPGNQPNDPYFYVSELYGIIKVVRRNGVVSDYADSLLNFDPGGAFPGSGEQGLSGIVVDSLTGDVYAALLYDATPPSGPHYPKVVRFTSTDGGLTAATQTTILNMPGESQGQSHFISNLTIGPDGKLYVHMGDGFDASTALNLNSFRGKILRVNLNGTAPANNPFYNAGNGITATDYVYAYGVRNPFGGTWRASDGQHYEVENGPSVDRFAKITSGSSYGWNGSDGSMAINAIYNWNPSTAPVNIAFIQSSTFGGSEFPAAKMDHAFVTESGPTWASGPQSLGKRISEFVLGPTGTLISGPTTLIEYNGSGKATASGLAAGPDGLYFADLYKDIDYMTPIDRGANVLRIKFVGSADFEADETYGAAPLTVNFTDLSNVPSPGAWHWEFGDSTTSTAQHPSHTYTADGVYTVRLVVTGANGNAVKQRNAYIIVGDAPIGLKAEYYDDINLNGTLLTRIDPAVDFDWGNGSPDPSMGSDDFSVRWTGQVMPEFSQTYRFYVVVDDGVRLWVNNDLLIDRWIDQPPTEWSDTISLSSGQRYDIKMEYYENGGGAVARLSWQSPSQPWQIIPQNRLYPFAPTTNVHVGNGWNIISLPRVPGNDSLNVLFPSAVSPAFKYTGTGGYQSTATLNEGTGYWLRFATEESIPVAGSTLDSIIVPVLTGWNLIGAIGSPVSANDIAQTPAGNVVSDYYVFTPSGYAKSDTLHPGIGYWVKVAQNGQLELQR
ncbi:MAG: PQQ-dependent sugar dehydrogenase [Bacteroidota bacterium]